mgnify:FL=1
MGYTADEFIAVLPGAMRDWPVSGGPEFWRVAGVDGGTIALIRIQPRPERVMGSLRLPVLAVTIDLLDVPAALAGEFMRRFDRGFHRGGG